MEYGFLVSGIAAVIAVAVYAFGGAVQSISHDNCSKITGALESTIQSSCDSP